MVKNIFIGFIFSLFFIPISYALEFMGYQCTDDCSGHKAGHMWARLQYARLGDITPIDCINHSLSFEEGCMAFIENNESTPQKTIEEMMEEASGRLQEGTQIRLSNRAIAEVDTELFRLGAKSNWQIMKEGFRGDGFFQRKGAPDFSMRKENQFTRLSPKTQMSIAWSGTLILIFLQFFIIKLYFKKFIPKVKSLFRL